jgi:hypothetical protein
VIGGAVWVDLADVPEADDLQRLDRHRLAVLERTPDGARVTVDIGARTYVSQDAAYWLHHHDARLDITITGTEPASVLAFVRAARAGDWSVVA